MRLLASMPPRGTIHRRAFAATTACALAWLAGCQATPAPTTLLQRSAELELLGFVRTDEGWEYPISGKLLFDTASDTLDPESQAVATRIGSALTRLGIDHLRVEGHTDNVGAAAFNQALSLRRAEAVAQALAAQGLPLKGIEVRGWGKDRPVVANDTPAGRLQNRRVAVIVPAQ